MSDPNRPLGFVFYDTLLDFYIPQLVLLIEFPKRTNHYGRRKNWFSGDLGTNFILCRRAIFFRRQLKTGQGTGVTAYLGP